MIERVVSDLLSAVPRVGFVRLLAVDGPSGSGKSTFATALTRSLRARGVTTALVRTDDFATWDDPVAWWPRLADGVLGPLAAGQPGGYRRMEWTDGVPRLGGWVVVPVSDVLVLEGVSAGRRAARALHSGLVWVELAGAEARLTRAVERDGEAARGHLRRWQSFESGWFAVDRPWSRATARFETKL